MIDALQRLLEAGHSAFFECLALFLLPFAHEDVTILGGSLLVVEHQLPVTFCASEPLRRHRDQRFRPIRAGGFDAAEPTGPAHAVVAEDRPSGSLGWSHTPEIVMMARLLPGLMFPLYVACGLYRVSLLQFGLTTVLTAADDLPIVFLLFSTILDNPPHPLRSLATGLGFLGNRDFRDCRFQLDAQPPMAVSPSCFRDRRKRTG